jgi:2-polyprenyl-3-methyl-5-hydroxy-6-metoxy-1,4-benzoquinol methylase
MASTQKEQLQRSWIENASAWRDAVREHRIASRRIATDAAIVDAVMRLTPKRVLDLGCGEGWLSRELASRGVDVVGVDASQPLIESANELGGAAFFALSFEEVAGAADVLHPPFDVAVANFAVFEEDIRPVMDAATRMLKSDGALLIQTIHPAFGNGDGPYVSGWREETFATMGNDFREAMPWYFRTLADWTRTFADNGYYIAELIEPLDENRSRPLSMIFICRPSSSRSPAASPSTSPQ